MVGNSSTLETRSKVLTSRVTAIVCVCVGGEKTQPIRSTLLGPLARLLATPLRVPHTCVPACASAAPGLPRRLLRVRVPRWPGKWRLWIGARERGCCR